jgi:hypothetical protein
LAFAVLELHKSSLVLKKLQLDTEFDTLEHDEPFDEHFGKQEENVRV